MSPHGPGWVPNQHGAWAMVVAPLVLGALAGGFAWVQVPLFAFWLIGYFAFFATSQWLRSGRRAKWFPPVRFYGLAAAGLGVIVVFLDPGLTRWAPLFIVPAAVGLWAAAHRRDRDLLVGLTTVAGSSFMAVVAYDAGAGPDGSSWFQRPAWLLAAVLGSYFAGTVFYVKSVIRERGNRPFLGWSLAYHAACVVATAAAGVSWDARWWWLAAIFGVLLVRAGWVWRLVDQGRRITPRVIGIGEAVATVAVAVAALWVAGI